MRAQVEVFGCGLFDEHAIVHHRHVVGHSQGFHLIMGHVQGCHPQGLHEALQLETHFRPQLGIQVTQGLVQEQDSGFSHQGSGQGDTLLLPTAQKRCRAIGQVFQMHQTQGVPGLLTHLLVGKATPARNQGKGDIVEDGQVRPDGI